MRRFLMSVAVISLVWTGIVGAQTKITTPEEFEKAMLAIGGAFGPVNKALASGMAADAKAGLTTMRTNLVAVQGFWEDRKKEVQINYAKAAVAGRHAGTAGGCASAAKATAWKAKLAGLWNQKETVIG